MIHVDRSAIKAPSILSSPMVEKELKEAEQLFAPNASVVAMENYHFKTNIYFHSQVKEALYKLFHKKCVYCESKLSATGTGAFEHFRPKWRAMNLDGEMSLRHYWWLAYEWENLYISCQLCNRMKGARFPVRAPRATAGQKGQDLLKERALLLDPCVDQPEEHLTFLDNGEVASDTDEGKATIEIVGLGRAGLVESRREIFGTLKSIVFPLIKEASKRALQKDDELLGLLASETDAEKQYATMRRQVIRRWLIESKVTGWEGLFVKEAEGVKPHTRATARAASADFQEHTQRQAAYSVERKAKSQTEVYFAGAKRIERIEIKNFRAIEKLNLVFPLPPEQGRGEAWLALLGENAVGKSSILQAIALALMGERHANDLGLDARRCVRHRAKGGAGEVKVYLTNIPGPITLTFTSKSRKFSVEPKEPKVLLLGYGATRLLPPDTKEKGTTEKYVRVKNLFVPTAPLSDAVKWLSDTKMLPDAKFRSVAASLRKLLMLDPGTPIRRKDGSVTVKTPDGLVPLQYLSDGLQSVVALCTDIMIGLLERWPDVEAAEGVVLLDEIEVHLHPRWKIEIVSLLREVFPRVAFIISTHDPLCLKGLSQDEIVVLRRSEESGRIYASHEVPAVEDMRADQLLISPLFGLYSTRGRTPGGVTRYAELLGMSQRTRAEQRELESLSRDLGEVLDTAETPLGKRANAALDQTLLTGSGREVINLFKTAAGGAKSKAALAQPKRRGKAGGKGAPSRSKAGARDGARPRALKPRPGAKAAAQITTADTALRTEIKIQLARLLKK